MLQNNEKGIFKSFMKGKKGSYILMPKWNCGEKDKLGAELYTVVRTMCDKSRKLL